MRIPACGDEGLGAEGGHRKSFRMHRSAHQGAVQKVLFQHIPELEGGTVKDLKAQRCILASEHGKGRDQDRGRGGRHSDAERAPGTGFGDFPGYSAFHVQKRTGALIEQPAGLGQFNGAPAALEKGDLKLLLQHFDMIAHGRLGQVQTAGSFADAARIHDFPEKTELMDFHGHPSCSSIQI